MLLKTLSLNIDMILPHHMTLFWCAIERGSLRILAQGEFSLNIVLCCITVIVAPCLMGLGSSSVAGQLVA